ncbi:MAG TPA: SHOCT domain-containing protein, partial [bacterium]|nr:SHOCT domain-containing protein [bacterium]
ARRVALRVYEPTSDPSVLRVAVHHIIVEAGEGLIQVAELLVFTNTSDRTYIGGTPRADGKRETLRLTLPRGAGNVQYMDGLMECCVFPTDTGFVDTMDVEPGMREIAYTYTLPAERGALALTRRLDYPAERVEVFGSRAFTMRVSPLQPQADVQTEQGVYARFSATALAAGTDVQIALSGLPVPRGGARRIAVAAFAGIVAAALIYPLLRQRNRREAPPAEPTREELIAAVAALDDRFEAGEISEAEYRERRARYLATLRRLTAA